MTEEGPFDKEPEDAPTESSTGGGEVEPTSDERMWAMVAHISGVLSSAIIPIIVSLVIYMIKRDESEFIADQAKEALNFQITVGLLSVVFGLAAICVIGIPFLIVLALASIVFGIIGGIRSYDGQRYRYPYTLRLI